MIENDIIYDSDDYPGNDFYCIGVRLDSPEELETMFVANEEKVKTHSFKRKKYGVLQMGATEIWKYDKRYTSASKAARMSELRYMKWGGAVKRKIYDLLHLGSIEQWTHGAGYVPFYNAGMTLKLKFEEWMKAAAKATPCYIETEFSREIPFVFLSEVLNIFEYTDIDYSKPCDAKLACLACGYEWYESEDAFKKEYSKLAVESFFPLIDGGDMLPGAVINGYVTHSEMLKNELTGQEYCYFRISCQGYEFDCFSYDMLLYVWDDLAQEIYLRVPQPGDIVHGTFRMEVKIV